jgi:Tol biopolymer transport system component
LERVTTEPVDETRPALSPNGKILLFAVAIRHGSTKRTIVGVDPNTRAQRTLYTSDKSQSLDPAWLLDGSSYIFVSDSPGSLSLVRALTDTPNAAISVVASGEIAPFPSSPTLAPDGKRIAFQTRSRGSDKIAIIGSDGSRLTFIGEGDSPAWSPDGKRVVFGRTVSGKHHLFAVNPETGTDLVQLTSGDYDHSDPAWSPDGSAIIFSTNRGDMEAPSRVVSKGRNLYVINADGTGLTQLTAGSARAITPFWAKDNWIYFASDQEGDFDIWRLRPAGRFAELSIPRPAPAASSAALTESAPPTTSATPTAPAPASASGKTHEATPPATGGCVKDTDCKGDRICESGNCVAPSSKKGR